MNEDFKYISCALFLKGYLNPFPARSETDWNEIHYIANQIKRYINGSDYTPIDKEWSTKGSVLYQARFNRDEQIENELYHE